MVEGESAEEFVEEEFVLWGCGVFGGEDLKVVCGALRVFGGEELAEGRHELEALEVEVDEGVEEDDACVVDVVGAGGGFWGLFVGDFEGEGRGLGGLSAGLLLEEEEGSVECVGVLELGAAVGEAFEELGDAGSGLDTLGAGCVGDGRLDEAEGGEGFGLVGKEEA